MTDYEYGTAKGVIPRDTTIICPIETCRLEFSDMDKFLNHYLYSTATPDHVMQIYAVRDDVLS